MVDIVALLSALCPSLPTRTCRCRLGARQRGRVAAFCWRDRLQSKRDLAGGTCRLAHNQTRRQVAYNSTASPQGIHSEVYARQAIRTCAAMRAQIFVWRVLHQEERLLNGFAAQGSLRPGAQLPQAGSGFQVLASRRVSSGAVCSVSPSACLRVRAFIIHSSAR